MTTPTTHNVLELRGMHLFNNCGWRRRCSAKWREARVHSTKNIYYPNLGNKLFCGNVRKRRMPRVFSERSVYGLQRQIACDSHAQFIYYAAFAAIQVHRFVAQACFNLYV